METNLCLPKSGRMKLREQNDILYKVISDSFQFLHGFLVTQNAFPDTILTRTFVFKALIGATTNNLKAIFICKRLLDDHLYAEEMCSLVCCLYLLLKDFDKKEFSLGHALVHFVQRSRNNVSLQSQSWSTSTSITRQL